MPRPSRFTKEVDEKLIKLWPRFRVSYIAQELGIPKQIIRNRAHYLGLT